MVVWDGMDLIGLAVLGVLIIIWILIQVFLLFNGHWEKSRKKRWERMAKKDDRDIKNG